MTAPLACWRCEQPGHGYADCHRQPAATAKELAQRISRLVERWDSGHGLPTRLKQQFITIERREYEKGKAK